MALRADTVNCKTPKKNNKTQKSMLSRWLLGSRREPSRGSYLKDVLGQQRVHCVPKLMKQRLQILMLQARRVVLAFGKVAHYGYMGQLGLAVGWAAPVSDDVLRRVVKLLRKKLTP